MRLSESILPVTATRPPTAPVVLEDGLAVRRTSKRTLKLWAPWTPRRPAGEVPGWTLPLQG